MGVSGLSQFVEAHPTLGRFMTWSTSDAISTVFFIDGNAYVHQLKNDWVYGGNYSWMAAMVKERVDRLRSVGIEPVFLFDGSIPLEKLPTRKKRRKRSIECCTQLMNQLDLIHQDDSALCYFLLPPWALDVVISQLNALKVRVELCEYEADGELVRLAEEEGGYVVSQDSDMYIYPRIGKGYIPLSSLRVDTSVDAEVFCPGRLAELLKLSPTDLPLLGTLMGNDYMPTGAWKAIIERNRGAVTKKQWPMAVAEFINRHRGDNLDFVPEQKKSHLAESIERYIPNAVACTRMINNQLSRLLVDVIKHQMLWTSIFLEDVTKPSSWVISQKLRQAVYEIQRERLEMEEYGVIEYIRIKQHLEEVMIYSSKRTQPTDWDWFTELHSSRSICLQPVRKSDGLIFLTLCLRYMIAESTYEPEKLADHEVLALVLACLVCLAPSLGFEESKLECGKPALNRRSVHILAQYQTVVYSSYILSQMLPIEIQAPLLQLYHGPYFHYCLEKTRGGDGIGSLLPDVSPEFVTLLNKVYRLTTQNLEIRQVFEYGVDVCEKPRRVPKPKRKAATSKLTQSNNSFDLLEPA